MYVSCQDAKYKKQCIGVAYSDTHVTGPYRWITDRPLISRVSTLLKIGPDHRILMFAHTGRDRWHPRPTAL